MEMSEFEIRQHWRLAKARDCAEIHCLADLNAVSYYEMESYLDELGLRRKKDKRSVVHMDFGRARELILSGLSDREIAVQLGVGRSTVTKFRLHNLDEGPKRVTAKAVVCVETGQVFPSGNAAAQAVGKSPACISQALRGLTKTAAGYHWEYYRAKDKES